jgi:mannose-6-phosphate isomerase-like protein (cupin superfamily)
MVSIQDKGVDELELKKRGNFPYYQWMQREGIPIHFDIAGLPDITALERKPWARTGKGLGTFLELAGTFQAERGMFVCEIPPGEALDVQHHLYEQFTLILQGQGATEIWQKDGPKRTFEWGKGSLFAPPKNTYYRMFNLSKEPVIYFGVTNAPRLMNGAFGSWTGHEASPGQFEFIFNCEYDFLDLYDGREDYFARTENRVPEGRYNTSVWYTNYIPNVNEEWVSNQEQKVAGGQLTGYRMAGGFPSGHISEWPVGRYHKAHFHGPGAVLIGLKGHGYVNLWPRDLGVHPWQDGHADQVALVEWGPNSIYVPPDGWFHQHMSTGQVPARHVAVYGGSNPMAVQRPQDEGGVFTPVREGGPLIDYEDEDPEVRRYFIEANRKEGVECTMPPVTFRTDPFKLTYKW